MDSTILQRCAELIATADGLLIAAGAGMGVDSGLPDFRGPEGFWKAYPPYARLGVTFEEMANPAWFEHEPEMGWGFYGHRLSLYRRTTPHAGFAVLRRWADRMPLGCFIYTSNVDHHFQRAGFAEEQILEVHGSIEWLQCTSPLCPQELWPVDLVQIDETTMRASPPLPICPTCGRLARPSILMFGDGAWNASRSRAQERRFRDWCAQFRGRRLTIVECGAGTAVPTVRWMSESLCRQLRAKLIRVNLRDPDVPPGQIGLSMGARAALEAIEGNC